MLEDSRRRLIRPRWDPSQYIRPHLGHSWNSDFMRMIIFGTRPTTWVLGISITGTLQITHLVKNRSGSARSSSSDNTCFNCCIGSLAVTVTTLGSPLNSLGVTKYRPGDGTDLGYAASNPSIRNHLANRPRVPSTSKYGCWVVNFLELISMSPDNRSRQSGCARLHRAGTCGLPLLCVRISNIFGHRLV